ncbi:YcxB family protein [Paradevosia shaoguanensis]|uniref:YcxB family protein n=1 Tax=Paradevosia shaoguanensis TaxID=1335043 RepID=A0AA41QKH8_9HYPH|nr:YcxB family protein [Paradevosia shaoguanensis]MCF1741369.1 YcxB family protein [Paradevosia shaoguanensis]MCI0125852.1 YcxB family protein [Paradevosia shaoguanensis]
MTVSLGRPSVPGSLAINARPDWAERLLVTGYFALLPRQARKIYGQQKTMQHPVEASWNSEAYSAATAVASSTVPWGEYHGWSADETMILLMHSPVLFLMIPRHALNAAQAADLTKRLQAVRPARYLSPAIMRIARARAGSLARPLRHQLCARHNFRWRSVMR